MSSALDRLIRCLIAEGEFEAAIGHARRWLGLDPLNEAAHFRLMQLFAWSGSRSSALREYQECARLLEREVGASPDEATVELYEAIRKDRVLPPASGYGAEPPEEGEVKAVQEKDESPSVGEDRPLHSIRQAAGGSETPSLEIPTNFLLQEIRFVTVLALIMRGATEISGSVDRTTLERRFISAVRSTASKYGGRIERAPGERLSAVFGRTRIRESDPEAAVRSALEICAEAGKLGLEVTAGVNTGGISFGDEDPEESPGFASKGGTAGLALRLAELADPGEILAGESTYRLTRSAFDFTEFPFETKVAGGPVTAYRVERLSSRPAKARGIEGLRAELIGREKELDTLKETLSDVLGGEGRIVSIAGEAGVGKSRLASELITFGTHDDASTQDHAPLWLEGRCLELGMAVGYWLFIDIFRAYFAWRAEDDEKTRAKSIVTSLHTMVERGDLSENSFNEIGPLLGNLLSVGFGNEWDEVLNNADPEQIKHRTFMSIRDFLLALSKQQPVVLVLEDLHWADPLSLDLIPLLMEMLDIAPVLLLCVYRPETGSWCRHLAGTASRKCP